MGASDAILEQWMERTAEVYPRQAVHGLTAEPDRFRNPVGHALRRGLSELLRELFGEMNPETIDMALDTIIRIRSVQGFSPSEAAGFVLLLKPVLRDFPVDGMMAVFDGRIDQLAVKAADKYTQCREQLAQIRVREVQRANLVQQRMRARRPV